MNKKAAIELSVNFIVIIIISLVILGAAILITRQVFRGATELKATLDTQTEAQIEALLEEGKPVAVAFNRKTIGRGEHDIFGVGVLNIEERANFNLEISFNKAFNKADEEIFCDDCNDWLLYSTDPFELGKNVENKIAVLIDVPKNAQIGDYIFDVVANKDGSQYYNIQKIYVVVP